MGKRSAFFLSYNERVLRSCNGMATPCATTSPYNCLAKRHRAITLLREDSVARLIGSLANSAR